MKFTVRAPGTCGELVQGSINNINFHITCPINSFSYVTVELNDKEKFLINDPQKQKVIEAVNSTMQYIQGKSQGASITVNTQLPIAKGMASSTADIVAACSATAQALNYHLSYKEVAQIALSIEPSDGLFFPGIVAFDHVKGKYYKKIGEAINLDIIIFDFGGTVDTIAFNQRKDLMQKNLNNEDEIKRAIHLVERGLHHNIPQLVAQGATISALVNQSIIYKPNLEEILNSALQLGALGINIAHSGTIIGIIIEKDKVDTKKIIHELQYKYKNLKKIGVFKLIDGGIFSDLEEEALCSKKENMVGT